MISHMLISFSAAQMLHLPDTSKHRGIQKKKRNMHLMGTTTQIFDTALTKKFEENLTSSVISRESPTSKSRTKIFVVLVPVLFAHVKQEGAAVNIGTTQVKTSNAMLCSYISRRTVYKQRQ